MKLDRASSLIVPTVLTVPVMFVMFLISVEHYALYGATMFLLTPLACGCLSSLLFNRTQQHPLGATLKTVALAAFISLLAFLLVGAEGLICILMASPIVYPMFLLGGFLGYLSTKAIHGRNARNGLIGVLILMLPLMLGFESKHANNRHAREVTSRVIITGSPEAVWKEVLEFSPIPAPDEFLFRMGIAYPTHAEIKGKGVGAVRYCHFSTGAFVEPITVWEENSRLAFNVTEQPLPMTEVSPYVNIHPPHLDWAFKSKRGEFILKDLEDGRVELIGTTWYDIQMEPASYWGWLSDDLIHRIHLRVLNHIKSAVEIESHEEIR